MLYYLIRHHTFFLFHHTSIILSTSSFLKQLGFAVCPVTRGFSMPSSIFLHNNNNNTVTLFWYILRSEHLLSLIVCNYVSNARIKQSCFVGIINILKCATWNQVYLFSFLSFIVLSLPFLNSPHISCHESLVVLLETNSTFL